MLKRQHTEGSLDDGVVDLKRSRIEDMALVAVPSEESQQLIIAENNNKVINSHVICAYYIGYSKINGA
jgi:hypothetical protein